MRITYVGHSTVLIEMDGVSILTDPVLRNRVAHLTRESAKISPDWAPSVDAVLVSHLHRDHCDLPSLRRLGSRMRICAPNGSGKFFLRRRFQGIEELQVGHSTQVGPVRVTATFAQHPGNRMVVSVPGRAIGFIVQGTERVYFAGDTDLFSGMNDLADLDVTIALLPVWGWGKDLGEGHLDPHKAAIAAHRVQPRIAVPIHWGTFRPIGSRRAMENLLTSPPRLFQAAVQTMAPSVSVEIVEPGGSLTI
jgi:L-ascorbate metabolism protein UlaG (beta-lactamase superfamily)